VDRKSEQVVIGLSVAGVSAALRLAGHGKKVVLLDYMADTASLGGSLQIQQTPLNSEPLAGPVFEEIAVKRLGESGVEVICGFHISRVSFDKHTGSLVLLDTMRGKIQSDVAIFAPNGTETGLPDDTGAVGYFGWGVSYDAWSDASFFKGKDVLVIGCGYRAFEQACLASEWASSVTVVCDKGGSDFKGRRLPDQVRVRFGLEVITIVPDTHNRVAGVIVSNGERIEDLEASAIFVASDIRPSWQIWGGEGEAQRRIDEGKLYLSGLAAGVPYHDHMAQFDDGIRTADLVLAV